ncbi:SseB family protein [Cellulomonas sp. NPDC058312]|uniref:SseB family protein n=1 Tax=Cellulomonas sp. NPDC058312 TaxID=3346441 RepID=UPI0036EB5EE5
MTGRELPPTSAFAGDDGSADPGVAATLTALGDGTGTLAEVVAALAGTRVLVPVLAELEVGETVDVGGHAHTVDKEASAGIVALQAPDGRTALPVFSSVAAMAAWRADARPVPTEVARAALSAVDEGWELLVLDAGGPVTALLPRPAVWALAQQGTWRPAVPGAGEARSVDPEVRAAVRAAVTGALGGGVAEHAPAARSWFRRRATTTTTATPPGPLVDADALPGGRAEVAVVLTLVPGLDRDAVDAVLQRVGAALAADETVAQRVDSVEVRLR